MSDKPLNTMESKNIKDYLHLYLGCELYGTYNDSSGSKGILTGVTNFGYECEIQFYLEDGINVEEEPEFNESKEVKLILRPLSDMTEEEMKEYKKVDRQYDTTNILPQIPIGRLINAHHSRKSVALTVWLLSRSFDLFGLIDAGLAIKKSH